MDYWKPCWIEFSFQVSLHFSVSTLRNNTASALHALIMILHHFQRPQPRDDVDVSAKNMDPRTTFQQDSVPEYRASSRLRDSAVRKSAL